MRNLTCITPDCNGLKHGLSSRCLPCQNRQRRESNKRRKEQALSPKSRPMSGTWDTRIDYDSLLSSLHASRRAIDALSVAPGPMVCRVLLSGVVVEGSDRMVASERTVLAMGDASDLLYEYACGCAESVMRLIPGAYRPVCRAAIEAKRRWLRRDISDGALVAAENAAMAANYAATSAAWPSVAVDVWKAAVSTLQRVSRSNACVAAWHVARTAAWAAALEVAGKFPLGAAYEAEFTHYNDRLEEMLHAFLGTVAESEEVPS